MVRKIAVGSGLLIGLYLLTNQKRGNLISDVTKGAEGFAKTLQGR